MELFKKLFQKKPVSPTVTAIVAAAGAGTRMRERCPQGKQLLELAGLPVLIHTLIALEETVCIKDIIIVTREEDIVTVSDYIKAKELRKVKTIVKGGETRQQSVFAGLKECAEGTKYILIHDGARPFVTAEEISRTVDAAVEYGAAALGAPITDTVKRVDRQGYIKETVDRTNLWAVQTPQVFPYLEYHMAVVAAQAAGKDFTDDCQLFEGIGKRVYMVEGSAKNIKLTTPEDVDYAEFLLLDR